MDETIFDTNLLANIIKKILRSFEEWNSKISFTKVTYSHIDVTLLKANSMYYTIQVTNYGQSTNDILSFSRKIFSDLVITDFLCKNSLVVTIYSRNEYHNCHSILDLSFVQRRLSLIESTNDKCLINFRHQKKYLSFQLKNTLIFCDIEILKKIILDEVILLQRLNPRTKFTIHDNQKLMYNNYIPLDDDYKSCQVLATALTNVIKQSLDIKFKENCFSMLKVDNSYQVETAFIIKLLPLIHENYTFFNDS